MTSIGNSPFGKRLRATADNDSDEEHTTSPKRLRSKVSRIFGISTAEPGSSSTPSPDSRPATSDGPDPDGGSSETLAESTPITNLKERDREYGDRFVPSRDAGDMRTSYHLLDGPSTPQKNRVIPSESDAAQGAQYNTFQDSRYSKIEIEQANTLFSTILHAEITPPSPERPVSPVRQASVPTPLPTTPTRRRLFNYTTPSGSAPNTPSRSRRLDMPTDEAYSLSPVRAESRRLLESPRRELRDICKTPYRVLDAPELAEDFYLNLVDWSSTNVLGVGLGACVYLWTAHNASVSKLCDLSSVGDLISSVSWVQRVR